MAKTISLNRAIGEKALLTDRIAKLTENLTAVMIGKENGSKVKGIEQTELAKTIKADWQQLQDLMKEKSKLEDAIIEANSKAKITVNGVEYTIAQALLKKKSIADKKEILKRITKQYSEARNKVESSNQNAEAEALNSIGTTTTAKGDLATNQKTAFDLVYKQKSEQLIDPLGLAGVIKELEEEILSFGKELDLELTDINAVTKVTY